MLELPITIREPKPEEMPHRDDLEELLQRRREANISQGFTFKANDETHHLPFRFYAEINIDNSRLWPLFLALAAILPEELRCEYAMAEDEATITDMLPKEKIMQQLSRFRQELQQDAFLEFGLLFQAKGMMIELFVTASKYIRYWGVDEKMFRDCMKDHDLHEAKHLAFVDEYPRISEPLQKFIPKAMPPQELINELNRVFNIVQTSDDWNDL